MTAISYPFTMSSTGKIVATSDINKVYLDRLLTLISTLTKQRAMRPSYGVNLGKGVYENAGNMILGLESEIKEAITKWLPYIELVAYNSSESPDDGTIQIDISVRLPDNEETGMSVKVSTVSNDGTTSIEGNA